MNASADLTVSGLTRQAIELLRGHPLPLLLPPVLVALLTGGGNQGGTRFDARDLDPASFDPLSTIPFYALVAGIVVAVIAALVVVAIVLAIIVVVSALVYTATSRALLDHLATGAVPDFGAAFRAVSARWTKLGWTYFLACILVLLGFIALVVPGVILLAGLIPLFAVLASESISGADALRRAWSVSKGRKGTLALLILGGVLANILVGALLGWIPVLGWLASGAVAGSVTAVWLVAGVILFRASASPAPAPVMAPEGPA